MTTTAPPEATSRKTRRGPGSQSDTPVDVSPILAPLEAILISSDRPLQPARIGAALGLDDPEGDHPDLAGDPARAVSEAVDRLNEHYEASGRAFRIRRVAGGWRIMTLEEFGPYLTRLHGLRESHKLSRAAIETLAIVAYRQPITRAEIEAIRGVACGDMLRALIDRHLVTISGRAEELGRPMLYSTTKHFLETFGLSSIKDLPDVKDVYDLPAAPKGQAAEEPEAEASDRAQEQDQETGQNET